MTALCPVFLNALTNISSFALSDPVSNDIAPNARTMGFSPLSTNDLSFSSGVYSSVSSYQYPVMTFFASQYGFLSSTYLLIGMRLSLSDISSSADLTGFKP